MVKYKYIESLKWLECALTLFLYKMETGLFARRWTGEENTSKNNLKADTHKRINWRKYLQHQANGNSSFYILLDTQK